MSNVTSLVTKYKASKAKFRGSKAKFNPTKKWIEYSLDLLEAKKFLQIADFNTKFQLLNVIKQIESKLKFHENHNDFDLKTAMETFRSARKLLRL